jgi:hypothetical protein
MQDNRGPKTRFFDDVIDLGYAAQIANTQLAAALDPCRAIKFEKKFDSYTMIFPSSSIDCLLFMIRDLEDRALSLSRRAEELFPDDDKDDGDRPDME